MDNQFQLGLIILGLIVVIAIITYNKWQEYKHKRLAEKTFSAKHRDVLLEPVDEGVSETRIDPVVDHPEQQTYLEKQPSSDNPSAIKPDPIHSVIYHAPEGMDARCDCIIRLEAVNGLLSENLWQVQSEKLHHINQPLFWFFFDDSKNCWLPMTPNSTGSYNWFCVAFQMVGREGMISEMQLNSFIVAVQNVADKVMLISSDIPTKKQALLSAQEIDHLCAEVDVSIGINIVNQKAPFLGSKVRLLAESEGMSLGDDGVFYLCNQQGNISYRLMSRDNIAFDKASLSKTQIPGLTLVMELPLVPNGVEMFNRMYLYAEKIARTLDGVVIDDANHPFSTQSVELVRQQIMLLQQKMEDKGIVPGSAIAYRLFS